MVDYKSSVCKYCIKHNTKDCIDNIGVTEEDGMTSIQCSSFMSEAQQKIYQEAQEEDHNV